MARFAEGFTRKRFSASGLAILTGLGAAVAQPDITFFATSDPHYGKEGAQYEPRYGVPASLNALPGQQYPASVGGGAVGKPRGVLLPGDMVEFGNVDSLYKKEWSDYTKAYGVAGEGELKFPVYEGMGNHDAPGHSDNIRLPFIARNKLRAAKPELNVTNMDTAAYNYSWDWDGVHFVNLNCFAGNTQYPNQVAYGGHSPYQSLDFLKADLAKAVGQSGRPVFIMQHFSFDGTSIGTSTTKGWWTDTDAEAFYAVIKDYNVIGLLHGHTHGKKIYKWKGLDVYDDGTGLNGESMIFHIKGTRMFAVNRVLNDWGTLKLDKTISLGSATTAIPRPRLPGDAPKLRLGVAGVGTLYDGDGGFTRAEIAGLDGRVLRRLTVTGSELVWDKSDAAGRAVLPGIYLVKLSGPRRSLTLKTTVPPGT